MQPGTERRGQPRVKTNLSVQLDLDGGTTDANIRDISLSGVCCITMSAMPVMTQVQLTIVLPGPMGTEQPIRCAGAVVRSAQLSADGGGEGFETAIFFTQLGESERAEIEDFVALQQAAAMTAQEGQA